MFFRSPCSGLLEDFFNVAVGRRPPPLPSLPHSAVRPVECEPDLHVVLRSSQNRNLPDSPSFCQFLPVFAFYSVPGCLCSVLWPFSFYVDLLEGCLTEKREEAPKSRSTRVVWYMLGGGGGDRTPACRGLAQTGYFYGCSRVAVVFCVFKEAGVVLRPASRY